MGAGTVAGPRSQNGSIEVQLQSNCLRIARIVTPVIVIHSTASAQSRVATMHLIIHELLAFLVVPDASHGGVAQLHFPYPQIDLKIAALDRRPVSPTGYLCKLPTEDWVTPVSNKQSD